MYYNHTTGWTPADYRHHVTSSVVYRTMIGAGWSSVCLCCSNSSASISGSSPGSLVAVRLYRYAILYTLYTHSIPFSHWEYISHIGALGNATAPFTITLHSVQAFDVNSLPWITMKMLIDHKTKHLLGTLSSICISQRPGRKTIEPNLQTVSPHAVRAASLSTYRYLYSVWRWFGPSSLRICGVHEDSRILIPKGSVITVWGYCDDIILSSSNRKKYTSKTTDDTWPTSSLTVHLKGWGMFKLTPLCCRQVNHHQMCRDYEKVTGVISLCLLGLTDKLQTRHASRDQCYVVTQLVSWHEGADWPCVNVKAGAVVLSLAQDDITCVITLCKTNTHILTKAWFWWSAGQKSWAKHFSKRFSMT